MEINQIIKKVEQSEEFTRFKGEHPDAYLAHLFTASDEQRVELGYYLPGEDKIVVFESAPLRRREPEEIFKKEGTIARLDLKSISVDLGQVRSILERLLEDSYPGLEVTKRILILQHLERPVWNATLVARSLDFINARIDATSGEVLTHQRRSLMSLGKG